MVASHGREAAKGSQFGKDLIYCGIVVRKSAEILSYKGLILILSIEKAGDIRSSPLAGNSSGGIGTYA